jgi:hypothetical protein
VNDHWYVKVALVFILVLFTCGVARTQTRQRESGSSPANSLKVSATVASPVWGVMKPDDKQNVVIANPPDPKQSFSHGSATKSRKKSAMVERKPNSVRATSQELVRPELVQGQDEPVSFNCPVVSRQFDVTQKLVIMEVSEAGKTVERPVIVTTIVPQ